MTLAEPAVALPVLDAWLAAGRGGPVDEVAPALAALAQASVGVARSMACAPLLAAASPEARAPAPAAGLEADRRTPLAALVDRAILDALQGAGVAWLASREDDAILTLDPRGHLAIAVAHTGGAADIAANVPTGSRSSPPRRTARRPPSCGPATTSSPPAASSMARTRP
jgi:fructose-1,6-bisphosphatase